MAITTLDPKTALVVIDLQKGILALAPTQTIADVLKRAGTLASAFRRHGLPVVLVNVAGGPPGRAEQSRNLGQLPPEWLELAPELDRQPSDHVVTKRTLGAFTGAGLDTYLKSQGVTQIVLGGVATSIGVESTARQAHELGFNVTLAIDAITDMNPDAHANSVSRIFPRLGETGTAQDVIDRLGAQPHR